MGVHWMKLCQYRYHCCHLLECLTGYRQLKNKPTPRLLNRLSSPLF